MRTFYLLSLLFIGLVLVSCGEDEACTEETWVGTWNQVSFDCDTEGVSFDEQLIITTGSEAGTLIVAGSQETFNGCVIDNGLARLEINGDNIEVTGFGCSVVYRK